MCCIVAKADEETFVRQTSSGFVAPQKRISVELDSTPAEAINYRSQIYEYEEEDESPKQTDNSQRGKQNSIYRTKGVNLKQIQEELEEEEQPDRLTELLAKSSFRCDGRTG